MLACCSSTRTDGEEAQHPSGTHGAEQRVLIAQRNMACVGCVVLACESIAPERGDPIHSCKPPGGGCTQAERRPNAGQLLEGRRAQRVCTQASKHTHTPVQDGRRDFVIQFALNTPPSSRPAQTTLNVAHAGERKAAQITHWGCQPQLV